MTKFNKQFKVDAVQYYHDHRDLGLIGCAIIRNLPTDTVPMAKAIAG